MITASLIELTKYHIKHLSIPDIIYAEVAVPGAMGNDGGIRIYILEHNQLICYENHITTNEKIYLKAQELLLKHQNQYKYEGLKIDLNHIIFDYHYGGMGNHILINNTITLTKEDGFFVYCANNCNYQISCSVQGVFNAVAYSIDNSKK